MKKKRLLSGTIILAMVATLLMGSINVSAAPTLNTTVISSCDNANYWGNAFQWTNAPSSPSLSPVHVIDTTNKTRGTGSLKLSGDFAGVKAAGGSYQGQVLSAYTPATSYTGVANVSLDLYPVNVSKVRVRLYDAFSEIYDYPYTLTPNQWTTVTIYPTDVGNSYSSGTGGITGKFDAAVTKVQVYISYADLVDTNNTVASVNIDNVAYQSYPVVATLAAINDMSSTTNWSTQADGTGTTAAISTQSGGQDGGNCINLTGNFGASGGAYDYLAARNFSFSENINNFKFWYKAGSNITGIQIRLIDNNNEAHQYTITPTIGAWTQYTITNKLYSGNTFLYSGTTTIDRNFDLPLKNVMIGFFRNQLTDPTASTTLLLDDISGQRYTPVTATPLAASGSTGFDTVGNYVINFNRTMDDTTVTGISLRTSTNATVPATGTYDSITNRYVLTPTSRLTLGTQYNVVLPGGLADTTGNVVSAASFKYTFTTGSATNIYKKIGNFESASQLWTGVTWPASAPKPNVTVSLDTNDKSKGNSSMKWDFDFISSAGNYDLVYASYQNPSADNMSGIKFYVKPSNITTITLRAVDKNGETYKFYYPVSGSGWQLVYINNFGTSASYYNTRFGGDNNGTFEQPLTRLDIGIEKIGVTNSAVAGTLGIDDISAVVTTALSEGKKISSSAAFTQNGATITSVQSGTNTITAQISNNSSSAITPVVFAAKRTAGKLNGVNKFDFALEPYTVDSFTANVDMTDVTQSINAYIWKDTTNIEPLVAFGDLPGN